MQHVDGHYHALPLTDVLRIHKRKYREPGKVEYGTAIYRCPVLLGQISVAARSLLSLPAITKHNKRYYFVFQDSFFISAKDVNIPVSHETIHAKKGDSVVFYEIGVKNNTYKILIHRNKK